VIALEGLDDPFTWKPLVVLPGYCADASLTMQGSWIVRQSVGSTPCLLGKAVDITYIRGPTYLEVRNC